MKIQKDLFDDYTLTKYCWSVMQNQPGMKPTHLALYFYILELNNRHRWIDVIGVPSEHTMKSLRISRMTYFNTLHDLEKFGLITCISKSSNQNQASTYTLRTNGFESFADKIVKRRQYKNHTAGSQTPV
jgi:RIO-like serine/threonine protein kinase